MEYEKDLGLNKVFVSDSRDSVLVFDRNSGEIHYSKNHQDLDEILANIYKRPVAKSVFRKTDENVFKLNLSTVCNLNCDYCFRDKKSHIQTDVEKAKKIIDFIIDDYAPHVWMYSFSVNLTSESLVELNKIREIKQYIDQRTYPSFTRKDFNNLESALRYLACFPQELKKNFSSYDDFDAVVNLLDSFLDKMDLTEYFPLPEGMSLPEWEAERYSRRDKLGGYDLREFNLRFLEALFPETILRKPHYAFYICTNGTVFNDDVAAFFKEIKLDTVCVSLDGPSSVHNLHRFFCDKKDSHGIIVENIKKFMAAGLKVSVAAVLTADYPYPLQLVEYFKNLGVSSVDMNVVRAGFQVSYDVNSIEKLLTGYEKLFDRLYEDVMKQDFSLVDLLKDDGIFSGIKLLFMKNRLVKRCKWNENTIFDDEGDIYPCDYFIGKRKFLRGSINSTVVKNVYDEKLLVDNRERCKDCWCKYLCGGTCYFNSFTNEEDISVPDPVECKFNKGIRVLSIRFVQRLLDAGFDLMRLWERLGFSYDKDVSFYEKFTVKSGVVCSLRGTLTKIEMEIKRLFSEFTENGMDFEDEIYISVLDLSETNSNTVLDVVVIIPVLSEPVEDLIERLDCKFVENFDFGNCISGETVSEDNKVEDMKNKISQLIQQYRIPVSGNYWYKSKLNGFLGYKGESIRVFMQRIKNVY